MHGRHFCSPFPLGSNHRQLPVLEAAPALWLATRVPSIMMWLWTLLNLLSAQSGIFLWLCNLQTTKDLPASTVSSNYSVNVQADFSIEEGQIMCLTKNVIYDSVNH